MMQPPHLVQLVRIKASSHRYRIGRLDRKSSHMQLQSLVEESPT